MAKGKASRKATAAKGTKAKPRQFDICGDGIDPIADAVLRCSDQNLEAIAQWVDKGAHSAYGFVQQLAGVTNHQWRNAQPPNTDTKRLHLLLTATRREIVGSWLQGNGLGMAAAEFDRRLTTLFDVARKCDNVLRGKREWEPYEKVTASNLGEFIGESGQQALGELTDEATGTWHWLRNISAILARQGKGEANTDAKPRISVNVETLTATLDGKEYPIKSRLAACWLKALAEKPGEWFTPGDFNGDVELTGVRTSEVRKRLPRQLQSAIETSTKYGARIKPPYALTKR